LPDWQIETESAEAPLLAFSSRDFLAARLPAAEVEKNPWQAQNWIVAKLFQTNH
jgi:hypothetical protein